MNLGVGRPTTTAAGSLVVDIGHGVRAALITTITVGGGPRSLPSSSLAIPIAGTHWVIDSMIRIRVITTTSQPG